MARILLLCVVLFGYAHARPNGAPKAACSDMTPLHYPLSLITGMKYDIASACYVIFPTDFMQIRVWDRNDDPSTEEVKETAGPLRGVFYQVRRVSDNAIVGKWSSHDSSPGLKTMKCDSAKDAVTHKNRDDKTEGQTVAIWTAPDTCEKNEEYEIRATIVRTEHEYQKIVVPLVCDPDYDNVDVMMRVKPPLPAQYCAQGSWAIIPKTASESFEKPFPRARGWKHLYLTPSTMRFKWGTGSTATAGTGPDGAHDGDHYFYYDASDTKKGDMAGLLSPFGIKGCFCFSFWCHMNTDGKTEFRLSVIGEQQRLILATKEVTNYWRRVLYSFTAESAAVFLFQVFSSGSDQGDVGLDDIQVTAGPCNVTITGYSGFVDLTQPPPQA